MYILFNLIPRLASAFSGGSYLRTVILILQLWYFALTPKTFLRGKEMRFNLIYLNKPFNVYIESIVDLAALSEVFLLGEYNWDFGAEPKVILDLGAHFGDTTLYYHLKYPDAHIYAVEPAPETFKRLLKNTSGISKITPIQAGVAEKDGFADLNIVASSLGNSFKSRSDVKNIVSVPVHTLQSLLRICNTDRANIIKFDIEGAEEALFGDSNPLEFADAYIGEVHADLIKDAEEFISKFSDHTIEKVNLSNPHRFIIKAVKKTQ